MNGNDPVLNFRYSGLMFLLQEKFTANIQFLKYIYNWLIDNFLRSGTTLTFLKIYVQTRTKKYYVIANHITLALILIFQNADQVAGCIFALPTIPL